jgi:NAD(P)-dependent dehydrogenase (short-subunit alcohol dehydrogenase family)
MLNKVVVITGGSSGFGRASALLFAEEGASVVVADVTEKPLAKGFEDDLEHPTADLIRGKGGQATFVQCDVTKSADVDAAVATAAEQFGRLDVMFNNAGIYRGGKLMDEFTEADLDACFNVNVKGTFFGTQAAVRQFRTLAAWAPAAGVARPSAVPAARVSTRTVVLLGRMKASPQGPCPGALRHQVQVACRLTPPEHLAQYRCRRCSFAELVRA